MDNLRFTAVGGAVTITTVWTGSAWDGDVAYSTDGATWQTFVVGQTSGNTAVTIPEGGWMELRGATGVSVSTTQYSTFQFTGAGTVEASGSVQSLVNGDDTAAYCYRMFYNQTKLVKAPELTGETLTMMCYASMFEGCSNLDCTPWIEATGWASGCFQAMFKGCAKLKAIKWNITAADFRACNSTSTFQNIVTGTVSGGKFLFTLATAQNLQTTWNTLWNSWTVNGWDFEAEKAGLLLTYGNLARYHEGMVKPLKESMMSDYVDCYGRIGQIEDRMKTKVTHHRFTSIQDMCRVVQLANNGYAIGDVFIFAERDVPDMWVSAVDTTGDPTAVGGYTFTAYTYTTDEAFLTALAAGDVSVGFVKLSPVEAMATGIDDLRTAAESYNDEVGSRLGTMNIRNGGQWVTKTNPAGAGTITVQSYNAAPRKVMMDAETPSFTQDYLDSETGTRHNIVNLRGVINGNRPTVPTAGTSYSFLRSQRYPMMVFFITNTGTASVNVGSVLTAAGYTILGESTQFTSSASPSTIESSKSKVLVLSVISYCNDANDTSGAGTCYAERKFAQFFG